MKIKIVEGGAHLILNSAGNWTVECWMKLADGKEAKTSVPQGISRGKKEKMIVGPQEAVRQINEEIIPLLKKEDNLAQQTVDELLKKEGWGGNTTLAVSVCFAKASGFLKTKTQACPKLMMLMFEGKKHGNPNLRIQEFMIVVNTVKEGVEFYQAIKQHLEKEGLITTVGSEGGFSPPSLDERDILELMKKLGVKNVALDIAANTNPLPSTLLSDIVRRYPIVSVEDPWPEEEKEKWATFFQNVTKENQEFMVIADDLTVTDPLKIKKGAEEKLFNGVIIKPNQRGTISEAIEAAQTAKRLGLKVIVSHRGEETNDSWIVDFALSVGADFVKFGAPCRGERVAKYNRLLQIE